MKHIFLTGGIQVGKSTVVKKTLALLNADYGGFRTYFSLDRSAADRLLYIGRAGETPCFDERCVVAQFFRQGEPPQIFTERFDTLGVQYIQDAVSSARLLVMDELGAMERNALRFKDAVCGALEGELPILGVIKLWSTGWVDNVRNHRDVTMITVDEENRDTLPERLARELRPFLPRHP